MSEQLFEGYPDVPLPDPPTNRDKRRAGIERRKARIIEATARGFHPLSLVAPGPFALRLLSPADGHTCGDCCHRYLRRLGGDYPKCELGPITGGPGTDVLARYPACTRWEAKE